MAEIVLNRRNEKVTPESVGMWFKRHPDIEEALRTEIVTGELPNVVVEPTIFLNGTFEQLNSVQTWLKSLRRTPHADVYVNSLVGTLKNVCKGTYPKLKIDLGQQGWSFRHPDRLQLQDCLDQLDLIVLHYPNAETSNIRRVMKSFMASKGVTTKGLISGAKSRGAGKMADMNVDPQVLKKMLGWVKEQSYEAYLADLGMYKTGTRVSAWLNAMLENLKTEGDHATLTVFDKGVRSKYPEGHPWNKYLSPRFYEEIAKFAGYPERKSGKIFTVNEAELADLNRKALQQFAPEILAKYESVMPNHMYRHFFAQHMLRLTDWNYAAVAFLGGWDVKSLEESYGKPDVEQMREWGLSYMSGHLKNPIVATYERIQKWGVILVDDVEKITLDVVSSWFQSGQEVKA